MKLLNADRVLSDLFRQPRTDVLHQQPGEGDGEWLGDSSMGQRLWKGSPAGMTAGLASGGTEEHCM